MSSMSNNGDGSSTTGSNGSELGRNALDYGNGDEPSQISPKIVSEHLIRYVTENRPGLGRFYKPTEINQDTDFVVKATEFVNKIRKYFGSNERVLPMSVLVLYDIVMLVDNSLSMVIEQEGMRKDTLKATVENVARITLATRVAGSQHIDLRTLNGDYDHKQLIGRKLKSYLANLRFEGFTPIGTILKKKILDEYVTDDMKKPLLVIITTDGAIEGEPQERLKKVITETADKVIKSQESNANKAIKKHAAQAVSYQFAKIGNDPQASDMVKELDDDEVLAPYIDCLLQSRLEDLKDDTKKWDVISKLFLGAIDKYKDQDDSAANEDGEMPDETPVLPALDPDNTELDEEDYEEDL